MKNIFILITLCFLFGKSGFSQIPSVIFGEWHIYEIKSDRVYRNFEKDSTFMFRSDDQSTMTDTNVKNSMTELFEFFSKSLISVGQNNIVKFIAKGEVLEESKFTFDSKLSILSFNEEKSLETLKLNSDNLLVYDLSNEYETLILTFKKKSN